MAAGSPVPSPTARTRFQVPGQCSKEPGLLALVSHTTDYWRAHSPRCKKSYTVTLRSPLSKRVVATPKGAAETRRAQRKRLRERGSQRSPITLTDSQVAETGLSLHCNSPHGFAGGWRNFPEVGTRDRLLPQQLQRAAAPVLLCPAVRHTLLRTRISARQLSCGLAALRPSRLCG